MCGVLIRRSNSTLYILFNKEPVYKTSQFLSSPQTRGLNPDPWQWKCEVLTTGQPGNSPKLTISNWRERGLTCCLFLWEKMPWISSVLWSFRRILDKCHVKIKNNNSELVSFRGKIPETKITPSYLFRSEKVGH